jgi:hypothetical protein
MDQTLTDDEINGLKQHLLDSGFDPYEVDSQITAIRSKYGPGQGRTAQDPAPADLFDNMERVEAGFGNPKGVAPMLAKKGYKNPQLLDGEYEAQGPDGKWYRDTSNFFRRGSALSPKSYLPEHPVNWAEAKLGKLFPVAGQTAGQIGGDLLGLQAGPAAVAAVPAAGAAGGAAGGYLGEGIRQTIGDELGTYRGDGFNDAADSAKEGFAGGLVGGLPIPGAGKLIAKEGEQAAKYATVNELGQAGLNKGLTLGRQGLAHAAGFLSRVKADNIDTLLQNPLSVWRMGEDGADTKLAQEGQKAVTGKIKELGKNVEFANKGLNMAEGQNFIHPQRASSLAEEMEGVLAPYRPGGALAGKMTPEELAEIDGLIQKNLYQKLPPGQDPPDWVPQHLIRSEKVGSEGLPSNLRNYYQQEIPIVQHSVPGANVEGLQNTANTLARDVGNAWDHNPIGNQRTPSATAVREKLYGLTKQVLHEMDNGSNGLEAADAAFHGAREAGKLVAPLNNEGQQQSFIRQLSQAPAKDAQRQALSELAPDVADHLPALKAALDLSRKSEERNKVIAGSGALLAAGEHFQQPILTWPAVAALGLGLAGHPQVIKYGLGGGALLSQPLWSLLRSRAGAQGLIDLGVPTSLDHLSQTLKNH